MSKDRLWCPECKKLHYPPTHTENPDLCNTCGTELQEDWPLRVRVRKKVAYVVAIVIVGAILFGPPAWVVWLLFSGKPLVATRTVTQTTTQYYGVLPEATPIVMIWVLIILIGWGMATGAMPRMR